MSWSTSKISSNIIPLHQECWNLRLTTWKGCVWPQFLNQPRWGWDCRRFWLWEIKRRTLYFTTPSGVHIRKRYFQRRWSAAIPKGSELSRMWRDVQIIFHDLFQSFICSWSIHPVENIKLLLRLREKFNLTSLIIAHGLSYARNISNCVAVMYLRKIFEITTRN